MLWLPLPARRDVRTSVVQDRSQTVSTVKNLIYDVSGNRKFVDVNFCILEGRTGKLTNKQAFDTYQNQIVTIFYYFRRRYDSEYRRYLPLLPRRIPLQGMYSVILISD